MKLYMAALFISFFLFSIVNAQQVTELEYKNTYAGKTTDYARVTYGESFVKIQTFPANSRNPARYIDKKANLLIMDFEPGRDFIVEVLDSVYRQDSELKATGEKKVIKGYNCEKYTLSTDWSVGGVGIYGLQTYNTSYSYTIWITKDLPINESYGLYISHALLPLQVTFPYNGVIVQLDVESKGKGGSIVLENVVTNVEPAKDFIRPWLREKPVAILPGSSGGYAVNLKYTRERTEDQIKRMRALLTKVTGNEKMKAKHDFDGIVF